MKVVVIIISAVLIALIAVQVFAWSSQQRTESYPYTLIQKYDSFETRAYDSSLFISVTLPPSSYKSASSKGFSILANYIFGGNKENKKIAMTTPVAMSMEDSMTMMFMVPKKYSQGNAPAPNEEKIKFKKEPAKNVAVIRFGGWANDARIEQYKALLISELAKEGIAHTNHFFFLGYNPPYEMVNRRNEVMVEIL
jgi:hypothetical protein